MSTPFSKIDENAEHICSSSILHTNINQNVFTRVNAAKLFFELFLNQIKAGKDPDSTIVSTFASFLKPRNESLLSLDTFLARQMCKFSKTSFENASLELRYIKLCALGSYLPFHLNADYLTRCTTDYAAVSIRNLMKSHKIELKVQNLMELQMFLLENTSDRKLYYFIPLIFCPENKLIKFGKLLFPVINRKFLKDENDTDKHLLVHNLLAIYFWKAFNIPDYRFREEMDGPWMSALFSLFQNTNLKNKSKINEILEISKSIFDSGSKDETTKIVDLRILHLLKESFFNKISFKELCSETKSIILSIQSKFKVNWFLLYDSNPKITYKSLIITHGTTCVMILKSLTELLAYLSEQRKELELINTVELNEFLEIEEMVINTLLGLATIDPENALYLMTTIGKLREVCYQDDKRFAKAQAFAIVISTCHGVLERGSILAVRTVFYNENIECPVMKRKIFPDFLAYIEETRNEEKSLFEKYSEFLSKFPINKKDINCEDIFLRKIAKFKQPDFSFEAAMVYINYFFSCGYATENFSEINVSEDQELIFKMKYLEGILLRQESVFLNKDVCTFFSKLTNETIFEDAVTISAKKNKQGINNIEFKYIDVNNNYIKKYLKEYFKYVVEVLNTEDIHVIMRSMVRLNKVIQKYKKIICMKHSEINVTF